MAVKIILGQNIKELVCLHKNKELQDKYSYRFLWKSNNVKAKKFFEGWIIFRFSTLRLDTKTTGLHHLDFKSLFLQIHLDVFHSESFTANRALQDQSASFEETEAGTRGGV